MLRLVEIRAPSGKHETGRREGPHLRTPAGFVFGGLVSGLFWGVLGVTAWLVI
jgi:hypothetical protein